MFAAAATNCPTEVTWPTKFELAAPKAVAATAPWLFYGLNVATSKIPAAGDNY